MFVVGTYSFFRVGWILTLEKMSQNNIALIIRIINHSIIKTQIIHNVTHSGNLRQFRRQLTSVNLGVWRKSENLFFSKKNYMLGCVMVQNIYFNTFFVKIDPGAPLKPPKSSFFNVGVKLRK